MLVFSEGLALLDPDLRCCFLLVGVDLEVLTARLQSSAWKRVTPSRGSGYRTEQLKLFKYGT